MTKYEVTIPEVWYQRYEVNADSEQEAIRNALAGSDEVKELGEPEYAFTLDSSKAYAMTEEEINGK